MENYIDRLAYLANEYSRCEDSYKRRADEQDKYKMHAAFLEMREILQGLSMSNYVSDLWRFRLQTILDKVNSVTKNNPDGNLSYEIMKVQGRIINNGRAKFQEFCSRQDVLKEKAEDLASYSRCIDFRNPTRLCQIEQNEVMYQWCMVKGDGTVGVGQWFSRTKVTMNELGLAPGYDFLTPKRKIFKGTGTRLLFKFTFPFEKEAFRCTAAGAIDTWSVRHDSTGQKCQGAGVWASGGAEQFFVPLSEDEKQKLLDTAEQEDF